jgi:hypothetical protein
VTHLNKNERESLRNDLLKMRFNQAKGKVRGMDTKARLVYLRNVQNVNQWATRYELPSQGVRVTLLEEFDMKEQKSGKLRADYDLIDVLVEPTSENKT